MINVYFIRHGLAGDRAEYADDSQRPLTSEGERKTRQVAKALKKLGLNFSILHTSPYIRANQTAEIFADVFAQDNLAVTVNSLLAPEGDLDRNFGEWHKQMETNFEQWQAQNFSVGLVGHEPDLSAWAEMLLWGDIRGVLVLKKAGIIGVTLPDSLPAIGKSYLFLLAPPKLLLLS